MSKIAETSLGPPLRAYLTAAGWELSEEVRFQATPGGPWWIADMVATRNGIVAVFEMKAHFGLDVMAQAARWIGHANQIFVVVPGNGSPANAGHAHGYALLARDGICVLQVREHSKTEHQMAGAPRGELPSIDKLVSVIGDAALRLVRADALRDALRPEHRNGSFAGAGTKNGERVSKTSLAHNAIREVLANSDGPVSIVDMRRAIDGNERQLITWAREKKIDRVQLDERETVMVLRLVEPGEEAPITATSNKSRPARYIPA